LLLAHPGLASSMSDADLSQIGRTAPDGGAMLETVAAAARSLPQEATLALLAEALRAQGADLDALIAEIAAEPTHDPVLAHRELAGAVRQTRMKSLKAEQDQLAAAGLAGEAERSRYRQISAELDQLRADIENEAKA
jgi:DNA primase